MNSDSAATGGERLLTVPQVAERMMVGVRKVWRLISRRELPIVKVGARGTRVRERDLDSYILSLTGNGR